MTIRAAAHAGVFYPATAPALHTAMAHYLDDAREGGGTPAALVAPHAGWRYCGAVMASAFRGLSRGAVSRVIHLGPSHYHALSGIVASGASSFATPLGAVPVVDVTGDGVASDAAIHAPEHALEVQLPFLQAILGDFEYIPLLVGDGDPGDLAALLESLGAMRAGVLTVVSSDLSHYLPPAEARARDLGTLRQVEALDPRLNTAQACGAAALNGVMALAAGQGWSALALDRRDTVQTGGIPRDTVVGYAATAFYRR